jgi:hypothetical protein
VGVGEGDRHSEIEALLATLTGWEREYGTTYGERSGFATTGEAAGKIRSLKEQLAAAGAVFHWDGAAYVVDAVTTPGLGGEGPPGGTPA